MRSALSLSRPLCRERNATLYAHVNTCAKSFNPRVLSVSSRPACTRTRRWSFKRTVIQKCAVAAPERHHMFYKSELGYRTDFAEQYSLLEILGKGNSGTVWLAASRHEPSQHVAVKVIPKSRHDRSHEETLECIRREVSMWGCLSGDSRYVAQLLGLYEDGGAVYLVQQLCMGGDLSTALKEGPLPEACCAAIMWCVLSAIRDCHAHHLALIDVKLQNFLFTAATSTSVPGGLPISQLRLEDQVLGPGGPCVVACDFGCSLSCNELMRGAKRAGSPVFFAPEQFTSSYGLGVDVWAAGVMLYLLLSGCYPFWDCKRDELETKLPAYQVMLAVCSAPITFDGPEWRSISRDARDLVSLMLDRNPTTRITAENALQHPWFARWMRSTAGPGAAAAELAAGAGAGPAKGSAVPRHLEEDHGQEVRRGGGGGSGSSRGSSRPETPLRERPLQPAAAAGAASASPPPAQAKSAASAAVVVAGLHEGCGGLEPGAVAAQARGEAVSSCGSNIVPLTSPLSPQMSFAAHCQSAPAVEPVAATVAANSGCGGCAGLLEVKRVSEPGATQHDGTFGGDGGMSAHSEDEEAAACSFPRYH